MNLINKATQKKYINPQKCVVVGARSIDKKEYNEKLEENIEKTIEYTNDKIKNIKNKINITLIVIGTIISIILLDTTQALLFKNSPLIGIRDEYLSDADSYVDKGILVNTYYCIKEKDIVRRGRNTQNHHVAKNSNVIEYAYATAFEALLGFLYLSKQDERLKELLNKCLD